MVDGNPHSFLRLSLDFDFKNYNDYSSD